MIPERHLLIGKSVKQIAEQWDVSLKTVYRWQDRHSLREAAPRLGKERAELIRTEYWGGALVKDLAGKYGVTLASIYRIVGNEVYIDKQLRAGGSAEVSVVYNVDFRKPRRVFSGEAEVTIIRGPNPN